MCRDAGLFCVEANLFINLGKSFSCKIGSLFGSVLHDAFKVSLVLYKSCIFSSYVFKTVGYCFTYSCLEIAVAFALKFLFDGIKLLAGEGGINGHKIVYAVLAFSILYNCFGVGNGSFDFSDCVVS